MKVGNSEIYLSANLNNQFNKILCYKEQYSYESVHKIGILLKQLMEHQRCLNPTFSQMDDKKLDHDSCQIKMSNKQTKVLKFIEMMKQDFVDSKFYTMQNLEDLFQNIQSQLKIRTKLYNSIKAIQNNFGQIKKQGNKRSYPKSSILVLKKYLLINCNNPKPAESEIKVLAEEAVLTEKQVANWFTNARNFMKSQNEEIEIKFAGQVQQRHQEIKKQRQIQDKFGILQKQSQKKHWKKLSDFDQN